MTIIYPPSAPRSSLNTLIKSLFFSAVTGLTVITAGAVALYSDKNIAAFSSEVNSQPFLFKEKSLELLLNEYFEVPMYVYVREGEKKVTGHDTIYTSVPYGDGKESHEAEVKERETIAYVFDAGTSTIHRFSSYGEHFSHRVGSYVPPGYKANRAEEYLETFTLGNQLLGIVPLKVGTLNQSEVDSAIMERRNIITGTPDIITLNELTPFASNIVFEESSLRFRERKNGNEVSTVRGFPLDVQIELDITNIGRDYTYKAEVKFRESVIETSIFPYEDASERIKELVKKYGNYVPEVHLPIEETPRKKSKYILFRDELSVQEAVFAHLPILPFHFNFSSGGKCTHNPFLGFDDQAQQAIFGYACQDGQLEAYQFLPYSSLSLEFDEKKRVKEILSATAYKQSIFLTQRGVHQVKAIIIDPTKFGGIHHER